MELKLSEGNRNDNDRSSINRTNVELKLGTAKNIEWWQICINRTNVELKLEGVTVSAASYRGINRTNVELKHYCGRIGFARFKYQSYQCGIETKNHYIYLTYNNLRINRTNVELKRQ